MTKETSSTGTNVVTPLISVIIPCYNASRFLDEAIASITTQTYTHLEIIAINDGSADDTLQKLEAWRARDPRIKIINNEANLRLIKTLNKGVEAATGAYIARMDADDVALPRRFETQLHYMTVHPEIHILSTWCKYLNEDGSIHSTNMHFCCATPGAVRFMAMFESPLLHPGVMAHAAVLKAHHYADTPVAAHVEDYELWCRLLNQGFVAANVPEYLLLYRRNPDSVSFRNRQLQADNHVQCSMQQLARELPEVEIQTEILKTLLTRNDVYNKHNLQAALSALNHISKTYVTTHSIKVNSSTYLEIRNWVDQRKVRMLLFHFRHGNLRLRTYIARHLLGQLHVYGRSTVVNQALKAYVRRN